MNEDCERRLYERILWTEIDESGDFLRKLAARDCEQRSWTEIADGDDWAEIVYGYRGRRLLAKTVNVDCLSKMVGGDRRQKLSLKTVKAVSS